MARVVLNKSVKSGFQAKEVITSSGKTIYSFNNGYVGGTCFGKSQSNSVFLPSRAVEKDGEVKNYIPLIKTKTLVYITDEYEPMLAKAIDTDKVEFIVGESMTDNAKASGIIGNVTVRDVDGNWEVPNLAVHMNSIGDIRVLMPQNIEFHPNLYAELVLTLFDVFKDTEVPQSVKAEVSGLLDVAIDEDTGEEIPV
jgi:hypothetical protein